MRQFVQHPLPRMLGVVALARPQTLSASATGSRTSDTLRASGMRFRSALCLLTLLTWLGPAGLLGPAFARDAGLARAANPLVLPASRQCVSNAQIVSFGLYGRERVFKREARGAALALRAWFGAEAQPIVRFNTRQGGNATPSAFAASLRAESAAMDANKDVLAV